MWAEVNVKILGAKNWIVVMNNCYASGIIHIG